MAVFNQNAMKGFTPAPRHPVKECYTSYSTTPLSALRQLQHYAVISTTPVTALRRY